MFCDFTAHFCKVARSVNEIPCVEAVSLHDQCTQRKEAYITSIGRLNHNSVTELT